MAEAYLYLDYVKSSGDSLYFLSKDFHDQGPLQDTVIIREAVYFNLYYSPEVKMKVHQDIISQLDRAKKIIVFTIAREGKVITPIDIRLLLDGQVMYKKNAGGRQQSGFTSLEEMITWDEMISRIKNIDVRFSALKEIRGIQDTAKRNLLLLKWYEDHAMEMIASCTFNEDCGWGGMEDEVVKWILNTQRPADCWRAIQLSNITTKDEFPLDVARLGVPDAYLTEEGINFLVKKIIDPSLPIKDKQMAYKEMEGLSGYMTSGYYAGEPMFIEKTQQAYQAELLENLLPQVDDTSLQEYVLPILFNLTNKDNWSALPKLKDLYQSWKFIPSAQRDQLGYFLFTALNAETWKELTGNENHFYIQIRDMEYDTVGQRLIFSLYQRSTYKIEGTPLVHLERRENGKAGEVLTQASQFDFQKKVYNFRPGYLAISLKDLTPGKWFYYAKGEIGGVSPFVWTSEIGMFVKE